VPMLALVSGRPAIGASALEWKESNALRFFAAGGSAILIGSARDSIGVHRIALDRLLQPWGKQAAENAVVAHYDSTRVEVSRVNARDGVAGLLGPHEHELSLYAVHPRWMRLTREDREALWRAAFP